MKKRLVSLLCALFILSICSISYASDGHELPWGKDFSTFKNLTFSHESNDIKYYVVKGEKVCEVTKVAAAKVTYAFKGGKLYARIVNIFDSSDLDKLYKHFSDSFGKSKVSTQDGWTVNKWTKGDVKIKLKEDIEGTVHKLTMYYMPLAN